MVSALKHLWHRDLVRDPVAHGWVLNLYRAGEEHPQRVLDYFPAEHAPDAALARDLLRHRGDEARHERLYARALARMGQPLRDVPHEAVFNNAIRAFTPVSFHIGADDDAAARRLKIAHFLAHAHHLERRIATSLSYHRDACERGAAAEGEAAVAVVLADEERHVRYTGEAVAQLLPRREAAEVMALHARAEAKANLHFSQSQVRALLRLEPRLLPRRRRLLYRLCAALMDAAVPLA